ncbi:hypothetical protein HDU98_003882, partial [Podochytrium sp. JEL0797]
SQILKLVLESLDLHSNPRSTDLLARRRTPLVSLLNPPRIHNRNRTHSHRVQVWLRRQRAHAWGCGE